MPKISCGKYCAAINCHNNQGRNKDKSFFSFPLNPERCRKWVINTRREDLLKWDSRHLHTNFRLCSDHFEDICFLNFEKNRLKENAVPTLFSVPNSPLNPCFEAEQQRKRKLPFPDHVSVSQITAQEIPPIVLPRKPQAKLPLLQNYAQPHYSDSKVEERTCSVANSNQEQTQRTVQVHTALTKKKPLVEFALPAVENSNQIESQMAREYGKRIKQLEDENKDLKNQVEYLRNESTTLEAELLKIFNRDQLRWIHNLNCRKSMEWSEATLSMSSKLRQMTGPKGYDFLRHLGFPFPSDRTVIRKS